MAATQIEKEIDALIKKGVYKNRDSLYTDAVRVLFTYRPELKIESAVEIYMSREISLSKAAEIAGIDMESFKEELKHRGLRIEIAAPDKEIFDKGMSALLKEPT